MRSISVTLFHINLSYRSTIEIHSGFHYTDNGINDKKIYLSAPV